MAADLPLTLFTTFKPFAGEPAIFQENALKSWALLGLDVLLIGDEEGVAEAASRYGFTHLPNVARSEKGVPFVSSMFALAREHSDRPYLAYINGDIILDARARETFVRLCAMGSAWHGLLTARRRNMPLDHVLGENGKDFWGDLRDIDDEYGSWDRSNAVDLFLFTRDIFAEIPDFAVGRFGWDNWLVWSARDCGGNVIDASLAMNLYHPIHGYAATGGWQQLIHGRDAARNRELMGGHGLSLDEATTHIFDGEFLTSADSRALQRLSASCPRTPEKEFMAGCVRLAMVASDMSEEALQDAARTLLERIGYYFPIMNGAPKSLDWTKLATVARQDAGEAMLIVQDFVSQEFMKQLQAATVKGREVCVRGTGVMAERLLAYLQRHGIQPAKFIDRAGGTVFRMLPDVPVLSAEAFAAVASPDKHLVLPASMHALEIVREYELLGFRPGEHILF